MRPDYRCLATALRRTIFPTGWPAGSGFDQLGRIDTLNWAIEITEQGAGQIAPDFPMCILAFQSPSLSYEDKFEVVDSVDDLEKASSSLAEDIKGTLPGNSDLAN